MKRIDGCFYNVVGLPVNALREVLCDPMFRFSSE